MNKKAMTSITSPKPQIKEEESNKNEQPTKKCRWGLGLSILQIPRTEGRLGQGAARETIT